MFINLFLSLKTGNSNQRWGVICEMDWDLTNADIICKELKFGPAIRVPTGSKYGECEGNCPKWLSRVKCYGSESKFETCDHDDWGTWGCRNTGMTASVECSESGRIQTRLLLGGRVPWEGRLVVKNLYGQLGFVCKDASFQKEEADVACKGLGYPGGAIEFRTQTFVFTRSYLPTVMNNINCKGDEESLWDCEGAPSKSDQFGEDSVFCRTAQTVSLRCDAKSAIEDEWEVCKDSFCDCNKEDKSVTCPNVVHEYAVMDPSWFFPSDAETLKFVKSQMESQGNFHINKNFYKMLAKNTALKSMQFDAKEQRSCVFNYDARSIMTIYNRKPDNIVDAFEKKSYTPPELIALGGQNKHCYVKPSDTDVCTDKLNCYRQCGTPLYVDDLEATVRALEMDTQKVHSFYQDLADLTIFDAESIKKVEIYAQTVFLNTEFRMPRENIKIVTRHFEVGFDADIKNGDHSLTDCSQGIYLENQRYYLVLTGAGNAKLEVWAESLNLQWKLQNCKLLQQGIPEQMLSDEYSLSSTLTCAKYIYKSFDGQVSDEAKNFIHTIVNYVKSESLERLSDANKADSFTAFIYVDSGEYLEELSQADANSATDEQVRFVPWLSSAVLSEVSEKWTELLGNTDKQLKNNIEKNVAVAGAKAAVSRSVNELEAAKLQAEVSLKSIELAQDKYETARENLNTTREAFEKGIQKKIEEEAAEKTFGILKAVVGFIGGALSAATDPISGVLDVLDSLADLAQALLEVHQMVKAVDSWISDQQAIVDSIVDPTTVDPKEYEDKVKFVDKVATLTVSVGAWEKMRAVTDAKIDPSIDGATDYQVALHEVAIYGKMLTLETIRNAKQARRIMELQSHVRSHKMISNTIESTQDWEDPDNYKMKDWTRKQAFKQKVVVTDVVKTYCEAYFYSHFQECDADQYVLPRDSIPDIQRKITEITIERLTSTSGFCAAPSRFQHKVIEINDEKRIKELKDTKALKISQEEVQNLFEATLERIRLTRVEVWLLGVTSPGEHDELAIRISQTGVFYDTFRRKRYAFTAEKPTSISFKYKPKTNVITREPEVDEDFKQVYMNPAPLGDWSISVPDGVGANDKMNFEGLDKIEVKFFGSSIDCSTKKKSFN